jgi:3-oxoacyl-[acyl-carrier protein] reductase
MALLDNQLAVITGAARGIGYAIATTLHEHGAHVVISSISGKVGMFGQTNYSAAKAGMGGLTKASAKELARDGIRVNAIQPGLIRTAMTEAVPADVYTAKLAEIPLGRAGEPDEIGSGVLFLASDLSS